MNEAKKFFLFVIYFFALATPLLLIAQISGAGNMSLNGKWQMGLNRKYDTVVNVPSIATDPTKMSDGVLWYKKEIKLPAGSWTFATLELKGARFEPQVYINGELVEKHDGGMAPLFFALYHKAIKPGNTVTLEIALASLKDVPQSDASSIPGSDHFRSNISSGLWDDVVLYLHGKTSIDRIIPFVDFKNQQVKIKYDLLNGIDFKGKAKIEIVDISNNVLIEKIAVASGLHDSVKFSIEGKLKSWSPENPNLYHLRLTILDGKNQISDKSIIAFGVKSLTIKNKQFYLNNEHFVAKGATVVWHRWMRTGEGRQLGYDTAWFNKNIVQRTKGLGGNYLRFHLGLPPERLLDLCDRYGLAVQFEWSFFHGMPASEASLLGQYKNWLDLAMRHPCVSFIHPYNETGGDQLKTAWRALDELLKSYPPLLLEDRDVMHIHKYWWSLFENLGLYYDNADVFPKAIMADEFGGNYLDQNGGLGSYSTVKETFLRFLGRTHTKEERLAFHAEANAKVAEYWRRIGAAGFSPFCALGSDQDGNNWFLGPLKEGNPKPVWAALAAAFSPQSVSLELWDRDFTPNQKLTIPVYIFNDFAAKADLVVKLTVEDGQGKVFSSKSFTSKVGAFGKNIEHEAIVMPNIAGNYVVKAELLNKPAAVKYPVVSAWDCRVFKALVPHNITKLKIGVANNETELKSFLAANQLDAVDINDTSAGLLLTSLQSWNHIVKGDTLLSNTLQSAVVRGKSVVMLDVGERKLGQGYPEKGAGLGPLQGVATVPDPKSNVYNLFGGIKLKFTEVAEPESHLQPDKNNNQLWNGLEKKYTWLWNGYRGGLVVPATDMEFLGLSSSAFMAQWKNRGAAEEKILTGSYYGYELQGFYEFSDKPNDKITEKKLRDRVVFLVNDAPALANTVNPNSPITVTDLFNGYKDATKGKAENLTPLANCGKSLTRTPVSLINFGKGKGLMIVSQLLTAGRMAHGFDEAGLYGIRYDEVAIQFVLNMMDLAVQKNR